MSKEGAKSDEVTEQLRLLFIGVAPERLQELEDFWTRYGPVVSVVPDDDQGNAVVMEAGLYRYLRFNHRMLRVFWLLSFSAWEGYVMVHTGATTDDQGEAAERFKYALETSIAVSRANDPLNIAFPNGIPEPGPVDWLPIGSSARAVGEIAMFASGWAFLHECKHIMHQQDGTSCEDDPDACHIEELSCDEFATRFLLERVGDYASTNSVEVEKVRLKRQLGIHFALFAIAVIGRNNWGVTETHPAVQSRIDQVFAIMNETGLSKGAAIFACGSFAALQSVLKDVPSPIHAIVAQAAAESWSETSLEDVGFGPPA